MKTTKIVLTVIACMLSVAMAWSQQRVIYGYDAAGNRISRDFEPLENIYEYGTISLTQDFAYDWTSINLVNNYINPVIILGPATRKYESDEATLRVKDVTTNSFKCQLLEWENLDGPHAEEDFSYLVVEEGVHKFGDLLLQAGIVKNVYFDASLPFKNVEFDNAFASTPVILSQIVSQNDYVTLVTRVKDIDSEKFKIIVQPSENYQYQNYSLQESEDVAYIAIEPGSTLLEDTYVFEANHTGDYVSSSSWYSILYSSMNNPAFLAQIQTFDGSDPVGLIYRNLTNNSVEILCEEERTYDSEKIHTDENVGYLLIENTQVQQKSLQLEPVAYADSTSGIQQDSVIANTFTESIMMYPNPNNGQFKIEFLNDFWKGGTARICNADGSVITTFKIHTNQYEYTIPNAAPGHYVVQFYRGKMQYSRIITVE